MMADDYLGTHLAAVKDIFPDHGAAFIAEDILYGEMEMAASFVPQDRTDAISEARTASEVYAGMKVLEKTLVHLIRSEDHYVNLRSSGDEVRLSLNRLGKYFTKLMQNFPFGMLEEKSLSCRLEVFRDVLDNLGGIEAFNTLPGEGSYPQAAFKQANFVPTCRAGFVHRAVEDIRKVGNSRRFRTQLAKTEERTDFVLNKMVSVIQNLFEICSKLLVIRVDFEYRVEARSHMTSKAAKQDLRKFLNNIRHQSVFEDLLGYIWRFEQGIFGGFHFHIFLFFRGGSSRKDIFYSIAAGKSWVAATEGRGKFHSCNANKGAYRYLGIGKISHADLLMQSALLIALKYLACSDKAQSVPGERSYGYSKPLEPTPKSLGGRPRSASASTIFTGLSSEDDEEARND